LGLGHRVIPKIRRIALYHSTRFARNYYSAGIIIPQELLFRRPLRECKDPFEDGEAG
jgi:hypothetical protein